jgi:SOS-response transcriptional repressor LexA/transcriptional regulator with XRE-family HTH domain
MQPPEMSFTLDARGLGQRIAGLRRANGWSQRRLAEAAGVSHGYIALLELGRLPSPGKPRLDAIARALSLPSSDALAAPPPSPGGANSPLATSARSVDPLAELGGLSWAPAAGQSLAAAATGGDRSVAAGAPGRDRSVAAAAPPGRDRSVAAGAPGRDRSVAAAARGAPAASQSLAEAPVEDQSEAAAAPRGDPSIAEAASASNRSVAAAAGRASASRDVPRSFATPRIFAGASQTAADAALASAGAVQLSAGAGGQSADNAAPGVDRLLDAEPRGAEPLNVVGSLEQLRGVGARPLPIFRWGACGDPRDLDSPPDPDRLEYPPPGRETLIGPHGFGVVVKGDSMAGRGIFDGDVVWVNPERPYGVGKVVLALVSDVDGEPAGMVVKTYARTEVGHCLVSETRGGSRTPVVCREFRVIGPVVGITSWRLPS